MRVTFQKHLPHHRLAIALRMAGIAVEIPTLPTLGLEVKKMDDGLAGKFWHPLFVRPK